MVSTLFALWVAPARAEPCDAPDCVDDAHTYVSSVQSLTSDEFSTLEQYLLEDSKGNHDPLGVTPPEVVAFDNFVQQAIDQCDASLDDELVLTSGLEAMTLVPCTPDTCTTEDLPLVPFLPPDPGSPLPDYCRAFEMDTSIDVVCSFTCAREVRYAPEPR